MIKNALNSIWSGIYILQIIIPLEWANLAMVFSDNVFSKTAFLAKIRDIHKIEKNYISITVFGYENQQQISNLCIKKYFHKIFWFDFIEKEDKRCYIPIKLEKKFFLVAIYCKYLVKQEN